ncbi:bactericidal permeability-increasing protein-like isoform X2 [Brienomyrus brachyistius]|uniref:bactericidal permeability-increasing protein-like isoform X2 n=1 Tax=Brienomyrus brachyistius TaxID=42636 RepID=UPI0020B23389|nr:bactericidal permeability-increasing protein-like isoform X2 [Brienomyrus brachyistius]
MSSGNTMSLWCLLVLLALPDPTVSTNPGVKVQITQQGLDYGRQIGIAYLQENLMSVNIPDISGSKDVSPIGDVEYRLSGMRITDLDLPQSSLGLVPGTGISLSIGDAFINLHGDWHVTYLGFIWLYNLFTSFIDQALRNSLETEICSLVHNAPLKSLNARVDKYAEIEYSMVTPPSISNFLIELSLKGEFYNIGQHQDPPFSAPPFSLPPQNSSMLYIGLSSFTANSAGFVYNRAGALSLYITDDMVPSSSPIRLTTETFGAFVPEISKRFPDMMMKLLVKTSTQPNVTFEPNNMTLQAMGTLTAYAILPNTTLEPLFILNMDASVSGNFYISGQKLAGSLQLNGIDMGLGTSYVGELQTLLQMKPLFNIFIKLVVIPKVNEYLQQGFPLPAIGRMNLINSKLQVQKDYMLIGTDVHFTQ